MSNDPLGQAAINFLEEQDKYSAERTKLADDSFNKNKNVGVVTSGTMSPSLKIGIGIGYVEKKYSNISQKLCIDVRGKKKQAIIVKPPFYKNGSLND